MADRMFFNEKVVKKAGRRKDSRRSERSRTKRQKMVGCER